MSYIDKLNSFLQHQLESQQKSFVDWMNTELDAFNNDSSQEGKRIVYFSFKGIEYHNPHNMQSGDYLWNFKLELADRSDEDAWKAADFSLTLSEGYLMPSPGMFSSMKWINDSVSTGLKKSKLDLDKQGFKALRNVICAYIMHVQEVLGKTKKNVGINYDELELETFEYVWSVPF